MRLTLRTLLAYLDGILDPKDAADLGKKIEESDFATNLVHRIRDVMRRLRLGAPSLEERGPGFDPNTVAEYLDNTLPTDRVTDFEKVCLDSDVHLAEVAASHQILTLVLGEPAEVDPESRQRMYQLKDIQSGPKPPPPPAPGAPAEPTGVAPQPLDLGIEEELSARRPRPKPTVPEYLRDSRQRPTWVPKVAVAVLFVCLTFVALQLLGQFEPGTPLGNQLVAWGLVKEPKEVAAQPADAKPQADQAAATPDAAKTPPDATPPAGNDGKTSPPAPLSEGPSAPAAEPLKPVPQPATDAPAIQPPTPAAPPKAAQEATAPKPEPPAKPETAPPAASVPSETAKPAPAPDAAGAPEMAPGPPDVVGKPPARSGIAGIGKPLDPSTRTPGGPAGIAKTDPAKAPPTAPGADAAPLPPEPLGRLMSNDQILLVDDPASGWTRVAANQVLLPRQLLVLPTYRPRVALSAVTLEIGGATRFELLSPQSAQDPPGVAIAYGRMLMMPLARPGTKLRLAFGTHQGVVTFDDADAVVAVEVHRVRTPGVNPETEPARVTATLGVATGNIAWQEMVDGKLSEPLPLAASQRLSFDGLTVSAIATVKELPRWISQEPMSGLDRRASSAIGQALQTDRPARVSLLEIATSRPQREVKWLSLRCLGYVNQFHDIVATLGDPARRLEWPDYIDELHAAVNRDPETAAAVRMALDKQYSQQAAQLYRMLWGYTDKDLEAGEDEKLVKALDDESLAVRVLAIWNLKDITGLGHYYQPEQTAARRQQAARRWRQRLDAKEIRLKSPEEKAGAAARENTTAPRESGSGGHGAPRDSGGGSRDSHRVPARGTPPPAAPQEPPPEAPPQPLPGQDLPPVDPMAPLPQ